MGGRCNALFRRQRGQKTLHLGLPHLARVAESTAGTGSPQHKSLGPVDIDLFGL